MRNRTLVLSFLALSLFLSRAAMARAPTEAEKEKCARSSSSEEVISQCKLLITKVPEDKFNFCDIHTTIAFIPCLKANSRDNKGNEFLSIPQMQACSRNTIWPGVFEDCMDAVVKGGLAGKPLTAEKILVCNGAQNNPYSDSVMEQCWNSNLTAELSQCFVDNQKGLAELKSISVVSDKLTFKNQIDRILDKMNPRHRSGSQNMPKTLKECLAEQDLIFGELTKISLYSHEKPQLKEAAQRFLNSIHDGDTDALTATPAK